VEEDHQHNGPCGERDGKPGHQGMSKERPRLLPFQSLTNAGQYTRKIAIGWRPSFIRAKVVDGGAQVLKLCSASNALLQMAIHPGPERFLEPVAQVLGQEIFNVFRVHA
jgi:hypothetical protein